jgi:hypothetical protein
MDIESLKKQIINQNYPMGSWVYKIYSEPIIATTAEYSDPDQIILYQNGVAIELWVTLHLLLVGLISFFGGLIINLNTSNPRIPFILVFPILFATLYFTYKGIKAFHSEIIIDHSGIAIKRRRYLWEDIFQTFIIDESNGRTGRFQPSAKFLVIVDLRGDISKFEISYLGTSLKMLATVIEYFKSKSNT